MKQNDTSLYKGHRERMREKLARSGARFFETYELLEMLLYHAIPRKNTHPTAKLLLNRFSSLDGVFSAGCDELIKTDGVGRGCAEFIHSVGAFINLQGSAFKETKKLNFSTYENAGDFFQSHFRGKKENETVILLLDAELNYIDLSKVYSLDMSSGAVQAKPFIDAAIEANASCCMIAHNHPYGSPFPTDADWETAKMLKACLSEAGIVLLECFVVTDECYKRFDSNAPVTRKQAELSSSAAEKQTKYAIFASYLLPLIQRLSKNPEELARTMSESFGNIAYLFEADRERLKGATKNDSVAELFVIIAALAARKATESFKFGKAHTEDKIKTYLKGFFLNTSKETIVILPLDREGRVLSAEVFSEGCVNYSSITPRQIIEKLVPYNADSFIMAHNHPGGVPEASKEDINATLKLIEALNICDIHLKSPYVVAHGECKKIEFPEK